MVAYRIPVSEDIKRIAARWASSITPGRHMAALVRGPYVDLTGLYDDIMWVVESHPHEIPDMKKIWAAVCHRIATYEDWILEPYGEPLMRCPTCGEYADYECGQWRHARRLSMKKCPRAPLCSDGTSPFDGLPKPDEFEFDSSEE